jgi:hypothetical protein
MQTRVADDSAARCTPAAWMLSNARLARPEQDADGGLHKSGSWLRVVRHVKTSLRRIIEADRGRTTCA